MITDETIATIKRAVSSGKPFFIAPGFQKPHIPYVCPKVYYDLYDHESVELSSHPLLDLTQDPISIPYGAGAHQWNNYLVTGISSEEARELKHHYLACISFIDAQVGKILDELERMDLLENTIIMLWSDHGYHLGDHGIWTKQTNYELGTRSPLIVYYPDMPSVGKQTNALVEYVDMYPTMLDLCGLEIPEWIEGLSFVPVLKNPQRDWKKAAFSQYPRGKGIEGYSIRTRDFRYTEWRDENQGTILHQELYDHRLDSLETINLAGNAEYLEVLQEHLEILNDGWEASLPLALNIHEKDLNFDSASVTDLFVYPNPATDYIDIRKLGNASSFSIFSVDGEKVKEYSTSGTPAMHLDVHDLPSGIYCLKGTGENLTKSVKFIKQ
jgi:iduronate 2-sulfatase